MPAWIRLPVRVTSGLSLVTSAGSATKAEQPPKKMEEANREERRSVFLLVIVPIYQTTRLSSLTFGICLGIVKLMPNNLPKGNPIPESTLRKFYLDRKQSLSEVGKTLHISVHKVVYWMSQYQIPRRKRPEANYIKHNPEGDPFCIKQHLTIDEERLKFLALGLYWGEGTKKRDHATKIVNTDPVLLGFFQDFLVKICGVHLSKIRYYLQIFKDIDPGKAKKYWAGHLSVDENRILVSDSLPSLGRGTYHRISKFGVLSMNVFNTKLKAYLLDELKTLGYVGGYSSNVEAKKMVK